MEDDPVNQIVMEAVLRDLGVQVLTAGSGEDALDLMEQRAVDLVLMDCHMPEMDGLTTTRHWRGKEARLQRPRVPVIASNLESDVSVTEYVDAFEGVAIEQFRTLPRARCPQRSGAGCSEGSIWAWSGPPDSVQLRFMHPPARCAHPNRWSLP